MTNLKIARFNGAKEFNGKTFYDYTLIDEKGYTFSILSGVRAPEDMPYLPVMICSYMGQAKLRVNTDMIKEYCKIE